jgi:hypothetical protein
MIRNLLPLNGTGVQLLFGAPDSWELVERVTLWLDGRRASCCCTDVDVGMLDYAVRRRLAECGLSIAVARQRVTRGGMRYCAGRARVVQSCHLQQGTSEDHAPSRKSTKYP